MARLTDKQRRFVEEYLVDLNATQAAIRAGYSKRTAQEQSSRLLSNVMVQTAIQEAMAARSERTGITQDMVVQELAAVGFFKVTDHVQILDGGGVVFTPTEKLTEAQKSALAWIKDGKFGLDVGFQNKVKALELLGKHLGMFSERATQQEQENDLVDKLLSGTEEDIDTDDLPEVQ